MGTFCCHMNIILQSIRFLNKYMFFNFSDKTCKTMSSHLVSHFIFSTDLLNNCLFSDIQHYTERKFILYLLYKLELCGTSLSLIVFIFLFLVYSISIISCSLIPIFIFFVTELFNPSESSTKYRFSFEPAIS